MVDWKQTLSSEFRAEAVRLAQMSGRSRWEVAADLGVGLSMLRNWIDGRREREMDHPPAERQEGLVAGGWLYLAVVLDLYSRCVVGWAASDRLHKELVLTALRHALVVRQPPLGLMHHSDRGS